MSSVTETPKKEEQTIEPAVDGSSSQKSRKRTREVSDKSAEPNKETKLNQPVTSTEFTGVTASESSDSAFSSASSSALITSTLSPKKEKEVESELTFDDLYEVPESSSTPAETKDQEKWEADEHKDIGDRAFKAFCESSDKKALIGELTDAGLLEYRNNSFKLENGIDITAGQIVALAGDFYGVPNKPIAFGKDSKEEDSKEARFKAAYETLPKAASEKPVEVQELLAETLKRPDKLSNCRFFRITQSEESSLKSRYTDLLLQNFDHFQAQAKEAYSAGHAVACATASRAATEKKKEDKKNLFVKALMQELFACHFLTDLASAGHIRTPRKELVDYIKAQILPSPTSEALALEIAGWLVNIMHDEDGEEGLWVDSNKHSIPWRAKGDGGYFEEGNAVNREQVIQAVRAGLEDIYRSYSNQPVKNDALDYVPQPVKEEKEGSTKKNHPALFRVREGELQVRARTKDKQCTDYMRHWDVETVCWSLFSTVYYFSRVSGAFKKSTQPELVKEKGLEEESEQHTTKQDQCLCM